MKKILLVVILFLVSCSPVAQSTIINNDNLRVCEIGLPNLYCDACASNSEFILENLNGVVSVDVNFDNKNAIVIYDPSIISKDKLLLDTVIQYYGGIILADSVCDFDKVLISCN
jgi:copper chaperone CopZ